MRDVDANLPMWLVRKWVGYPIQEMSKCLSHAFVAFCVIVCRHNVVYHANPTFHLLRLRLVRGNGTFGDLVSLFYPSPYGDLFRSIDRKLSSAPFSKRQVHPAESRRDPFSLSLSTWVSSS